MLTSVRRAPGIRNMLFTNPITPIYLNDKNFQNNFVFPTMISNSPNCGFGCRQTMFLPIDRFQSLYAKSSVISQNTDTNYEKAKECYEGTKGPKDHKQAFNYFKISADNGNVESQFALGVFYYCGIGMENPDKEMAFKYLRFAALSGHPKAQYCYGICLASGDGVQTNLTKAIRYFRLSADAGYDEAQYCLARFLYNGIGIPKNYETAAKYFKKASDLGNAKATLFYGICHYQGNGVEQDLQEAVKYFRIAAQKGLPEAQRLVKLIDKEATPNDKKEKQNGNQSQDSDDEDEQVDTYNNHSSQLHVISDRKTNDLLHLATLDHEFSKSQFKF